MAPVVALADTTAQKKKRLHFSIRACHPCACPCYSSLYHSSEKLLELCSSSLRRGLARADVEIFLRRHCRRRSKKTGKSSGQCTVEIPVQSTAREFHTSLPCRRTSPLVNNFLNPANSLLETAHKKKKRRVISGAMLLKKKNTICALSVHAQASTQVSFMSSQAPLHQGV